MVDTVDFENLEALSNMFECVLLVNITMCSQLIAFTSGTSKGGGMLNWRVVSLV
jgi:hypothetical protein